jgi:ssDNA thymidine ADP-ribosyltransferase, DarT
MPRQTPIRLFHITAISNLQAICASGMLVSKNGGAAAGVNYQNIAHSGIQARRSIKPVPNPPGGNLHDFVPFYFAPRSPMLFAIHGGKVQGCVLEQGDIIYFETTVDLVTSSGNEFVFYDRNASLAYSKAFTDLSHLDAVSWDLLTEPPTLDGYCKYFHNLPDSKTRSDRLERRQAEFLVRDSVSLEAVTCIGVITEEKEPKRGKYWNAKV